MAVNGVPNLLLDCPLRLRLRRSRVDGVGAPHDGRTGGGSNAGTAEAPGAPRPGASVGSPTTGGGTPPAGPQPGAAADPLAGARTPGSGPTTATGSTGPQGPNGATGQPAAGSAEGAAGSGSGAEGGPGSGNGGSGSGAAQQTLTIDPNLNISTNNDVTSLPADPLDNPSPTEQADRSRFQNEMAALLDQAQSGDPDAADALKQKFAEFQQKFLQPRMDEGSQLTARMQESQNDQFEKKEERADKRALDRDTQTWRRNVDARLRILQGELNARPNLKSQHKEQVAKWQRQLQSAKESVAQESAGSETRAQGDVVRDKNTAFRQVVAGTGSSAAKKGKDGKKTEQHLARRGTSRPAPGPKAKPQPIIARGGDGTLKALRPGPDGLPRAYVQRPRNPSAPEPKGDKGPAEAGAAEKALAGGKPKDRPELKGQRKEVADRPAVEGGAELGCLEPETDGGEFESADPEATDTRAEIEKGPKDSPAHVQAAGEAVQKLKTEEERQKSSDRRGALAATLGRVRKTRGDIAAAAENVPQQGAGQTAAKAMQRGAVMTVAERQRFGEDCKRAWYGVVEGGGSCESVVYLDPDLPRAARSGADVAEPRAGAEMAERTLAARPGTPEYDVLRSRYRNLSDTAHRHFDETRTVPVLANFKGWGPRLTDPLRVRSVIEERTIQATGGGVAV